MISKEEVLKIAKLARLQLNEDEIEKMQKDLSAVLDYFDVLKKAPKINVSKNTSLSKDKNQGLRQDKVVARPASLANNLVQMAPDKQAGYFKVKAIL